MYKKSKFINPTFPTYFIEYWVTGISDFGSLYSWIASVYNFTDPTFLTQSEKSGWNGVARLDLYDGCGANLETWFLASCIHTRSL